MKINLYKRSCPNCKSNKYYFFLRSKDYRFGKDNKVFTIVKCKDCGLMYLNPIFLESDLSKFYGVDFYFGYGNFLNKITKIISSITVHPFIKKLKKYKKNGRILDVGCGKGGLVLSFLKYRYDAYGLEINKDAKQFIEAKLKKRIIFSGLENANFEKKSFDVITAIHVLEHVYDLESFLIQIKANLKDDGVFYVRVPNNDFFEYKFFKKYAFNLEVPRHLSFFTKESLKKVLENAGFNEITFVKSGFYDVFSTPASFYHSIKYYLKDKGYSLPFFLDKILFFLMVLIRFLIRILSIFQEQDLQVFALSKGVSFDKMNHVTEKS